MRLLQNVFRPEIPILADTLLPDTYAKQAQNCDTRHGDLRAFRALSIEEAIALTTCLSLTRFFENDNWHFIVSENLCHYCKSPISDDSFGRVYFTGETEARFFANDNISGGGFDPSVDYYKTGIPAPTVAPTVATTGGGADYRGYVYSYVNSYGDEGPPSPIGADDDFDSGNVSITDIQNAPADRAINRIFLYRANATNTNTAEFQYALFATWFDDATAYSEGDWVIYGGELFKCTSAHSAGAWDAGDFTAGDDIDSAALLSIFPKTNYDPPPDGLTNLISMANGSLAGFVGNTVCFSEPFHPHAWPTNYRIPLDIDIVGMACDKNTITVAGSGTPYILYGTHPSTMQRLRGSEVLPLYNGASICTGRGGSFFVSNVGIIFCDGQTFQNATEALLSPSDLSEYSSSSLFLCYYENKLFVSDKINEKGFLLVFGNDQITFVPLNLYAHAFHAASDGFLYLVADYSESIDPNDPPDIMPLAIKKWEGSESNYLLLTYQSRVFVLDFPTRMSAALVLVDQDFYDTVIGLINLDESNADFLAAGLTGCLGINGPLGGGYPLGADEAISLNDFSISANVTFKLYVNGTLRKTKVLNQVRNIFRLPGGYSGDRVYYEISTYIPVLKVSIATSMDEL